MILDWTKRGIPTETQGTRPSVPEGTYELGYVEEWGIYNYELGLANFFHTAKLP